LVNSRFNIDRDMGIQFRNTYTIGGMVTKQALAISQGEGRNRTVGNQGGLEYTGRLELLPMGEFTGKGDYYGSDLKREKKPKLSLGITYDHNRNAARERGNLGSYMVDSAYNTLNTIFIDCMFKHRGLSFMAEFASKEAVGERLMDGDDLVNNYYTGNGLSLQAGYLMKNNVECAVRYTTITPELISGRGLQDMYTFGLSRYVSGHSLKIQTDFSYVKETAQLSNETSGSYIYRFQVEVAF